MATWDWRYGALALAVVVAGGWLLAGALAGQTPQSFVTALDDPTPVALAQITPTGAAEADPSGLTPALLLVQGLKARRLVLVPLEGSSPIEIDRGVMSWPLLPDPAGGKVLYATERAVMVLDIHNRRATMVGTLPEGGRVVVGQWSPDGEAVAFVVQAEDALIATYARADGRDDPVELMRGPDGLDLDVAWLADGRPVVLTLGLGPVGGFKTYRRLVDPATGESTLLPPDTSLIQPWMPWRSPDGSQQLYTTTTWEDARFHGACRTGSLGLAGAEWLPSHAVRPDASLTIAFEIEGLFMDRPFWLDDGRIVFRAIADPVCTTLESGLYVARLGDEPEPLVAAEPDYVADESDKVMWSTSYALSPDQARIAWTENDDGGQRAYVWVMPLDGGERESLFTSAPVPPDAVPFSFRDREMILYFIWLP